MNTIDVDIATFDSHQSLPSGNGRDDHSAMVDLVSQSVNPHANSSRKRKAVDRNEEGLPEKPTGPLMRLALLNFFSKKALWIRRAIICLVNASTAKSQLKYTRK